MPPGTADSSCTEDESETGDYDASGTSQHHPTTWQASCDSFVVLMSDSFEVISLPADMLQVQARSDDTPETYVTINLSRPPVPFDRNFFIFFFYHFRANIIL